MADSIGWGILATGGIAATVTADLQRAGLRVAAVGSRTAESAEAFGDRFDVPNRHGSYAELVADPTVDVVYVATPHTFHAEAALLAIAAGKHVLVEKSFTIDAAEARRVVDAAEAAGVLVLEAMWTRFLPHMLRIHEIIAAGTIGEVRTLIADHGQDLPQDPSHRLQDPSLGGGALLDLGVYPVSFAHDLFGAPDRVVATADFTATGVDRQVAAILHYDDGRTALVQAALDEAGPVTATITGTAGRIEIDRAFYAPTTLTVFVGGEEVERFDGSVDGSGYRFQALEVERLVAAGEISSPRLTPAQSVEVMETLDRIRAEIGLRHPGE